MVACRIFNRPEFSLFPSGQKAIRHRLRVLKFIFASIVLLSVSATAQQAKPKPTLEAGSEVKLSALTAAEWIQGRGPTSFEPGKIYVFECWATWCGPCIALIPHMNELHKKYYAKGLRVYGMNTWEDGKDKVEAFVQKKGAGMSYPVAYTGLGSAFETEWLKAAGVTAIPYAFVVRNGKLLLSTEASRLTDSLVEAMLSGDEGARQAAAKIKAVHDARGRTDALSKEIYLARRKGDTQKMAAKLKELEALDPGHHELSTLNLQLLMTRKEWPAALAALNEMPAGYAKDNFVMMTGMGMARVNGDNYPADFIKAVIIPYSEYIMSKGKLIGPNHFACLSILQWRIGDKQTATITANKGVEVAKNSVRANEFRTRAFVRFEKSVKEGTMPKFSDLMSWQIEAKKDAASAE